jgi:hypothetical protein
VRGGRHAAHRDDAAAVDRYIAGEGGRTRSIDDGAGADEEIVH